MKNELQYCKSCGHVIASNAKSCPNCGAKQKRSHPILTTFITLVVVGFLAFVVLIAALLISESHANAKKASTVYTTPDTLYDYTISNSSSTVPQTNDTVSAIRPEFKAAMDEYVEFFEEYCSFMQEYQKNPTNITLIGNYASMMSQYAEMTASMEAIETDELNDAELLYYLEVTAKIETMLMEVVISE